MSRVLAVALALFLLVLPPHPALSQVVYRGQDAVELKCAALLILGLGIDERHPIFDTEQRVVLGTMALVFLERIPGTKAQKKAAVDQILRRMIEGRTERQIEAELDRSFANCEALLR